jgi:hypothetical protein
MRTENSARIRKYARDRIIEPARKRGETAVRVVAGDVLKALHLPNSLSKQVCDALKTKEFLRENRLALEKKEGPPSMASTRVTYTFRLLVPSGADARSKDPLLSLWGIGKDVFRSLGGGEAFIRREREHFYDTGADS